MSAPAAGTVIIGVGNADRRDDGVGPQVARLAARRIPGVAVVTCPAEPAGILDAWEGARLAVIVDAAVGGPPGRVRHRALADLAEATPVSSHDMPLSRIWELGRALGRAPASVVVITVDVADTGYGEGLSPAVAAALPEAVRAVAGVLGRQAEETTHQQP